MLPSAFDHLLPPTTPTAPTALNAALLEAVKGVGRTRPNPPVGCVIVDDDVQKEQSAAGTEADAIIARGFHHKAGERHAEIVALDELPPGRAKGKTVVVTLEPCTYQGRTPPCVDRLVREGVGRVVVGAIDPNPRVRDQGVQRLRAAGVDVVVASGAEALRCQALVAPFATTLTHQRPYVVLKIASSLDGKVATRTRSSRSITGAPSRALAHRLRDAVDAVVVGAGTVLADDPALTVRDAAGRDPLRVILDRQGRVGHEARVFADENVLVLPSPTIAEALAELHGRGLLAVLVEAGPRLAGAILQAGVVDELWWFHAPIVVGSDGISAIGDRLLDDINLAPRFHVVTRVDVGEDTLTVMRPH
ncbi:MAG: bifunctional diaminohydroxyphosphoribosylaminopyrimidine deaminase/5-amino-6-(5-phosphoribosylamino)uracil reductase RibD [Deltaproteobacteria bacterium]|nr:bifunctional diaminohydroxyphosphoribosylaminopyrimidine deaminase/5-amino-6-(5-phosphoribosylamino)uracil reductase RibD [Deltaproteobacteria bacterium]